MVQVVSATTQAPVIDLGGIDSTVDAAVYNPTDASFLLPAGLANGQYYVVVNDTTTGVSMSILLTIGPLPIVTGISPSYGLQPATPKLPSPATISAWSTHGPLWRHIC